MLMDVQPSMNKVSVANAKAENTSIGTYKMHTTLMKLMITTTNILNPSVVHAAYLIVKLVIPQIHVPNVLMDSYGPLILQLLIQLEVVNQPAKFNIVVLVILQIQLNVLPVLMDPIMLIHPHYPILINAHYVVPK